GSQRPRTALCAAGGRIRAQGAGERAAAQASGHRGDLAWSDRHHRHRAIEPAGGDHRAADRRRGPDCVLRSVLPNCEVGRSKTMALHRAPPAWRREKAAAAALAMARAVWLAWLAYDGGLGVRPVTEAIRFSGDWALRLLWLALLIGPARRILGAPRLI